MLHGDGSRRQWLKYNLVISCEVSKIRVTLGISSIVIIKFWGQRRLPLPQHVITEPVSPNLEIWWILKRLPGPQYIMLKLQY